MPRKGPTCKEKVFDSGGWHRHPCSRRATKDGYCWQHHPDYIKEQNRIQQERYEEKQRNSPWNRLFALRENHLRMVEEVEQWLENTDTLTELQRKELESILKRARTYN